MAHMYCLRFQLECQLLCEKRKKVEVTTWFKGGTSDDIEVSKLIKLMYERGEGRWSAGCTLWYVEVEDRKHVF